jgi:hypothetical protein
MTAPAFPDLYERVRNSVKKRVARWPSAYASAQLVREYKALVLARLGSRARPYVGKDRPLGRWFREKWVDILTMKPCGSVKSASYYPVCRPERIARRLTPAQISDAVVRKQRVKSGIAHWRKS